MQSVGLARALHQFGFGEQGIAAEMPKPSVNEATETIMPPPLRHTRATTRPGWLQRAEQIDDIEVSYEADRRILWQFMAPRERPSFTPSLIAGMTSLLDLVAHACDANPKEPPIAYMVLASLAPGIFNLGGDLSLFLDAIGCRDRERLRAYAYSCVRGQHRFATNLGRPLCTIALVQGDALGGGFEVALAQQVIIAERQAKFGLPEVLFNLFPGMGAYSFLSRRLNAAEAERMIISGRVYSAEEMHEIGVVDFLVENGQGIEAVHDFVGDYERTRRTRLAAFRAREIISPIGLDELLRVADLWVDTALALERADLRKMRHLAVAQDRRCARLRS
jgi:DSF synthase